MKKKNLKQYLVLENTEIGKCIKLLDKTPHKFSIIVNKQKQILGSITDGDIRRGILAGKSLHDEVSSIMNKNVLVINKKISKSEMIELMNKNKKKQLPLVNKQNVIQEIYFLNDLNSILFPNQVIIMSGGKGKDFYH